MYQKRELIVEKLYFGKKKKKIIIYKFDRLVAKSLFVVFVLEIR